MISEVGAELDEERGESDCEIGDALPGWRYRYRVAVIVVCVRGFCVMGEVCIARWVVFVSSPGRLAGH